MRFSPDKTMVFFTSNLFGASYVFGVEVKKAENAAAADVKDTAKLGRQNPHIAKCAMCGAPGTRPLILRNSVLSIL